MKTGTLIPSYREGLSQLRSNLANMLPPQVLANFDKYAETLQLQIPEVLKLKTGDVAPTFALNNQSGTSVSLHDILRSRQVVLVFYRGAWCPYCNLQLNQLQSILPLIENSNATLIAVSPQTPDTSMSFVEKQNLKFHVLSDLGNVVAGKYTTVFHHDDEVTKMLKTLGIDFTSYYGDDSNEIAVPAVFVIGQNGKVKLGKSQGGDFRQRVEIEKIINSLNK